MARATLTPEDRDALIRLLLEDLVLFRKPAEMFMDKEARRRVVAYAQVADDLRLDDDDQPAEYEISRSLPALRRILTEWMAIADVWLQQHADRHDGRGTSLEDRALQRLDYRVELWATCGRILDQLPEEDG